MAWNSSNVVATGGLRVARNGLGRNTPSVSMSVLRDTHCIAPRTLAVRTVIVG